MRNQTLWFVLFSLLSLSASAAEDVTPVEQVAPERFHQGEGLGTQSYQPSKAERPFFDKLDKSQQQTGGLAGPYDITKQQGKYVGWFGIVRDVTEDAAKRNTTLTVEHKYFDGLTDTHIQALSFNGSGDFVAVLRGGGVAGSDGSAEGPESSM